MRPVFGSRQQQERIAKLRHKPVNVFPWWRLDCLHEALDLLQKRRGFKIRQLAAAGWPMARGKRIRECPSFGVWTEQTGRVCNRPFFCPNCFARLIFLKIYRHMEALIWRPSRPELVVPDGTALFFYEYRRHLWVGEEHLWKESDDKYLDMLACLDKARGFIGNWRLSCYEVDKLKPHLGGFRWHRIEIAAPRADRRVYYSRIGMFLVPLRVAQRFRPRWDFEDRHTSYSFDYTEVITRKRFGRELSKRVRFPGQHLKRVPPKWLMAAMIALCHTRTLQLFDPSPVKRKTREKTRASRGRRG